MSVPLRPFQSWYLRMECGKCGRERYLAETHMTIAGNLAFGLEMRRLPKAKMAKRIADVLDMVQLTGLDNRYPRELSGVQTGAADQSAVDVRLGHDRCDVVGLDRRELRIAARIARGWRLST